MAESAAQAPGPRTPRGRETRARILDAALDLFRERGYDDTTMRAVARRAGVALGNAYYYFQSKEHLIQAFYRRTHDEHMAACLDALDRERRFEARLELVLRTKLETSEPYHRFAGVLFRTAADPGSPLSPFSPESAPLRQEVTELFAAVVRGSDIKVRSPLADQLPNLLWLYQMGVLLYWIHDDSLGRWKSFRLVETASKVVGRLIRMSRLPIVRPLVAQTVDLMASLGS